MPTKKRAKKKTARKSAPRKRATKKTSSNSWFKKLVILIVLAAAIVAGIYYFGSFETRAKMAQGATNTVNAARTHGHTPAPLAAMLDVVHDSLPNNTGLIVEGGELGRDESSPLLAGLTNSLLSLRFIRETDPDHSSSSYLRLYDEKRKTTAALLFVVNASTTASAYSLVDAQFKMPNETATKVWQKALRELAQRYPKRFDEIWLRVGPIYTSSNTSANSLPVAHFAIAMDLTDEGGLRALALRIPVDAEDRNLNRYTTSIAEIEQETGLQFLPELDFSLRDTLINHTSPAVW